MLDTIVLTLPVNDFDVFKPDKFNPSVRNLLNFSPDYGSKTYLVYRQNPSKEEYKNGIYKPRLTITTRPYANCSLKIEFSAPKLVFNNNFDELGEDDFEAVVAVLKSKLHEMGVSINKPLGQAQVSAIHYSKNVVLNNGLTSFSILKQIQKSNLSKRLDFNQSDFRNEGQSIKFRTNSYEITFYDKIMDLQKSKLSEKRAIENHNSIQIEMLNKFIKLQKQSPFEVIRMEVRLNKRTKIKQILKCLNLEAELTFEQLFKKNISQKILLYYLNLLEFGFPETLWFKPKSIKDFISQFIIDNPKVKLKDIVLAYGFHEILKELTVREVRELTKNTSYGSWYRFYKKMNSFKYSKSKDFIFQPIRDSIDKFDSLRMSNYLL